MDLKTRFKNPVFWITLIGLFFTATRIDPAALTSWVALKDALISFLSNPFLIGTFIVALIGQFNNPVSKGLKD